MVLVVEVMMLLTIGLMVVLYPISPTLAPLPVLIRYGSIPGVVLIRFPARC